MEDTSRPPTTEADWLAFWSKLVILLRDTRNRLAEDRLHFIQTFYNILNLQLLLVKLLNLKTDSSDPFPPLTTWQAPSTFKSAPQ
jgi:hypothetical protein